MDELGMIRKTLKELDYRVSAIEHAIRTGAIASTDEKSLLNNVSDVKKTILKTASSILSKASDAINPEQPK